MKSNARHSMSATWAGGLFSKTLAGIKMARLVSGRGLLNFYASQQTSWEWMVEFLTDGLLELVDCSGRDWNFGQNLKAMRLQI